MRINKFLAEQGISSRRGSDQIIAEGRVTINGKPAKAGDDVAADDVVMVDGKILSHKVKYEYYLLNKPKGYVCTVSDDKGRKTVMDLLPAGAGRVFPVGRLDYDTEGMLILTNDGDLAYRLTAPRNEIPKTYLVRIEGTITDQQLNRLRAGVEIERGVVTKKCKITVTETSKTYTKLRVVLTEGKNREIRKMFEVVGKNVDFLKRLKIGELTLTGLDRGAVRRLTPEEVYYLQNL
ncbi:MAG TPA: rRNA pseudouridine synthase [Candidatus Gallimonas intestinigallinarum]|uniref:rRNA pseudouridine synthase n=1 Tax=Candidatus Gallimonas intestinigallinarum TaxID=2838604 RepID=A0A9D2IVJ8_9FIRM|nr:rRNA pseudouridine synthase [Candidatus Gallimonas intestinigallinarum]